MPPQPKKKRTDRPKKRRFHGNRFTIAKQLDTQTEEPVEKDAGNQASCASARKLSGEMCAPHPADELSGFRLVDVDLLTQFLSAFTCTGCGIANTFDVSEKRCGLSSTISYKCKNCDEVHNLKTSPSRHRDSPDVNKRFALGIYSIGGHPADGERLLAHLNVPGQLGEGTWSKLQDKIHAATTTTALQSMSSAAKELADATHGSRTRPKNVTVSCDNTWQRRDFQSKNCVSTVLSVSDKSPAKVLDVHCASN